MNTFLNPDVQNCLDFLPCRTPKAWIQQALLDLPTLLIDHAHCEKKAASTALSLMYRYVEYPKLLQKMSRLAREELRHFEQVLAILNARHIPYVHLSSARYAAALREGIRQAEPQRLIDVLIIGAIIEARSCERFYALIPYLDEELAVFYTQLLKSESRHYQDYLSLATDVSEDALDGRLSYFLTIEKSLIESDDTQFRFHSGVPQLASQLHKS